MIVTSVFIMMFVYNLLLLGFSRSRTESSVPNDHSTFMSSVIKKLNIHKPIIISPSASGSYSVPYVLSNPKKIGAFVPVAPCCVRSDGWENFMVCFMKFKLKVESFYSCFCKLNDLLYI